MDRVTFAERGGGRHRDSALDGRTPQDMEPSRCGQVWRKDMSLGILDLSRIQWVVYIPAGLLIDLQMALAWSGTPDGKGVDH